MRSFSSFALEELLKRYPELHSVSKDTLNIAADAYLFRFDSSIAADFVEKCLSGAFLSISEARGITFREACGAYMKFIAIVATKYFEKDWDQVDEYVKVNLPRLTYLRKKYRSFTNYSREVERKPTVVEVDDVSTFDFVLERGANDELPVIAKFYADYCSVCKQVAPKFEAAADSLPGRALFISVNGPQNSILKERCNVNHYPVVKKFLKGNEVSSCESPLQLTVKDLICFAVCKNPHNCFLQDQYDRECETSEPLPGCLDSKSNEPNDGFGEELPALEPYVEDLRRQGIDELEKLVTDRHTKVEAEIHRAISCGRAGCNHLETQRHHASYGNTGPVAILLGGGMGSGKSSVVKALFDTKFCREHVCDAIIVEADAFKKSDPLFTVLHSVSPGQAAQVVHGSSLQAAEELLLKAVNDRRDIVFDGTMAWFPYVKQTLDMLRDDNYTYKRGPGYHKHKDNTIIECYWEKDEKRPRAAPSYTIEMVGVTIQPQIAVARGIVRRISTGRGVPIHAQLESHRMYSKNFINYTKLFDASYLFDTSLSNDENRSSDLSSSSHAKDSRRIIAMKPGILFKGNTTDFQVLDEVIFSRFLRLRDLNSGACDVSSLYSSANVRCGSA